MAQIYINVHFGVSDKQNEHYDVGYIQLMTLYHILTTLLG